MGRMYVASGDFASGTAAGDAAQITAPSTAVVVVHGFSFSQSSTTTDEATAILVSRHTTAGSGGTTITPALLDLGDATADATVLEANTTDAAGTETNLFNYGFSVLAGLDVLYTPETRIVIPPSGILVWKYEAFTTGVDLEWSIIFEEIG